MDNTKINEAYDKMLDAATVNREDLSEDGKRSWI